GSSWRRVVLLEFLRRIAMLRGGRCRRSQSRCIFLEPTPICQPCTAIESARAVRQPKACRATGLCTDPLRFPSIAQPRRATRDRNHRSAQRRVQAPPARHCEGDALRFHAVWPCLAKVDPKAEIVVMTWGYENHFDESPPTSQGLPLDIPAGCVPYSQRTKPSTADGASKNATHPTELGELLWRIATGLRANVHQASPVTLCQTLT